MQTDSRIKYIVALAVAGSFTASAYYFPAETFLAFTAGWLFVIPAAFAGYMVYGFVVYRRERKHRIAVTLKPSDAMKALVRREIELAREKERILLEESRK